MVVKIEILGLGQFQDTAKAFFDSQKTLRELIFRDARLYGQILIRQAKEKHLSGPTTDHSLSVGKVHGGRLRSSITSVVEEDGDNAQIHFGTDVPYAAIHEFGGVIQRKSGKTIYSIVMPRRSFLQSSIDETFPDFQERVANTLSQFAERSLSGK